MMVVMMQMRVLVVMVKVALIVEMVTTLKFVVVEAMGVIVKEVMILRVFCGRRRGSGQGSRVGDRYIRREIHGGGNNNSEGDVTASWFVGCLLNVPAAC